MPNHGDDRFVAHFDMLGMSTLTKRDPESAWQKLCDLSRARNERLHLEIERSDTNEILTDQVHSFIFSDTMIAFFRKVTLKTMRLRSFFSRQKSLLKLFTTAFLSEVESPKGASASTSQQTSFSGPALVDAYELGETTQWLGIVVDERTAEIAKKAFLYGRRKTKMSSSSGMSL
ncbi:hypothetical protein ACFS3C_17000 [Azotobacter vinelandii]